MLWLLFTSQSGVLSILIPAIAKQFNTETQSAISTFQSSLRSAPVTYWSLAIIFNTAWKSPESSLASWFTSHLPTFITIGAKFALHNFVFCLLEKLYKFSVKS